MNIEFRLPNLTAADPAGQIRQLYNFLRQTVEQLNWAMGQLEQTGQPSALLTGTLAQPATTSQEQALTQFQNLKGLIIKSADIVRAYYQQFDSLLQAESEYFAQSEYGSYRELVDQQIHANVNAITQNVQHTEQLQGQVETWQRIQNSYLRYGAVGTTLDDSGLAAQDAAGIEIGDFHSLDDGSQTTVSQRFARFTAYGLELFGSAKDRPIAYISGNRLYITEAEILGNMKLGGYLLSTQSGLAFSWIEGGSNG